MDDKRAMLRHFLAAIAYRTQKAVRDAPASFGTFTAGSQVRTPADLVRHMTSVLGYARTFFVGGRYRADPLADLSAEIARFHASSLQARLRLDGATTEKVREQVEREFQQIKQQGLARPQRPESEQGDWYRRRKQALDEASARIEALIPLDQRQPHAVGQSLYLGTGMRTNSHVGPDGHGSVTMGLDLPGIDPF